MNTFDDIFSIQSDSITKSKNIALLCDVRVSVITDRLIRIEKSKTRKFSDMPSQAVLCRNFDNPKFSVEKEGLMLRIRTELVTFEISKNGKLLSVTFKDGRRVTDFKRGNLKGTRRTLDMTSGAVKIGDGILSKNGVAEMDDSRTLLLQGSQIIPREDENAIDKYYFAYGHSYNEAVADFYKLTGSTPLIPRFALGNWWSRYKAYTQDEYLTLMKRFVDEKIPITVATVDMDWHWVDVVKEFGKQAAQYKKPKGIGKLIGCFNIPGWTGYSWNTKLFPDYKAFLKTLHDENYKVTLNLHPAVGVRYFEDMYKEFAEYMGIDSASGQQIEFDITDKKFINGYFEFLHHKYESEGVDFWWIDWQQGNNTKIKGLDPLWALNHYHSLDSQRDNKRPLILSRFAGYGSHRYPLGFSGDTKVSWNTLKFQPYFTATASNIGYSWWSHDIGGHHFGTRDDELYLRWIQFGAFSPIMRLHSTSNEFLGKEPWKFSHEAQITAEKFLRLRHRMIPYIYTMNRLTNFMGQPLIKPMYYDHPDSTEAYKVPNEYMFGSEIIVAPITEKTSHTTKMSCAKVWLPEGRYTDIFTGRIYQGKKVLKMYRDTWSIPVLAKEGAIIPLSSDGESNNWKNPENMEILAFRGNGSFKMYEDDGETKNYENGEFAETVFEIKENGKTVLFNINPTVGDLSVTPKVRSYIVSFKDIERAEEILIYSGNNAVGYRLIQNNECVKVKIAAVQPNEKIEIILNKITAKKNPPKKELLTDFVSKIQGNNDLKLLRFGKCLDENFNGKVVANGEIKGAIDEIMNME
jgi:alpha-glucosidase (family GH31 glycosyl hydrolase)